MNRGKGKTTGELKKKDFYNYYVNNSKEPTVPQSTYNKFIKELLNTYSKEIVEKWLELKLNKLGKIRIRTKKLNYFNLPYRDNLKLIIIKFIAWKKY